MGIRGSTLEDKVQLRDLELHRFSLWRRPQFEAMWRRFKDAGLGFALDRDRLRVVLAQNGGAVARSGPVGSGKVAGTSSTTAKLFPLFDTDENDLMMRTSSWPRWPCAAGCAAVTRSPSCPPTISTNAAFW